MKEYSTIYAVLADFLEMYWPCRVLSAFVPIKEAGLDSGINP